MFEGGDREVGRREGWMEAEIGGMTEGEEEGGGLSEGDGDREHGGRLSGEWGRRE